jgi:hypothetical protein
LKLPAARGNIMKSRSLKAAWADFHIRAPSGPWM